MKNCGRGNCGDDVTVGWFPGYKHEIEDNKFRRCCNWVMVWWICALIIGTILCGIFVTQQGVVFKNFEPGECSISVLKYVKDNGCSCGKHCRSSYPCFVFSGTFDSDVSAGDATDAGVYNNYFDYKAGCTFKTCNKDKAKTAETIYDYFLEFYKKHGYDSTNLASAMTNPTAGIVDNLDDSKVFVCYGNNDGSVMMKYINSSLYIFYGTIPLIALVFLMAAFLKFATPGMKIVMGRFLCLPYYCITDRETTTAYLCNHRGPCGKGYCVC